MRILITGATGYIGHATVPVISKIEGSKILCLSRDLRNLHDKFDTLDLSNVYYSQSDDWDRIARFGPEIVVHLASYNPSRDDEQSIEQLIDSNITFGATLIEKLSKTGNLKFFINTGSFSQYDDGTTRKEDAYFYSATKSAFDAFLDYFSTTYGFKYITAVPFSVYGGETTVKRVIDYIYESLDAEQPIAMTAGEQILDFIHVDDIANFYLSAIEAFTQNGGVF